MSTAVIQNTKTDVFTEEAGSTSKQYDLDYVLFLDTETDCLKVPYPIQVAYMSLSSMDIVTNHYFKPIKQMEYEAIAIHGISHAEAYRRSDDEYALSKISEFEVLIGHNIPFDIRALGNPQCQYVDTRIIARYLCPEWEGYKLTTCMFYVHDTEEAALQAIKGAHDALTDLNNTRDLYFYLAKRAGIDPMDIGAMIALTEEAEAAQAK